MYYSERTYLRDISTTRLAVKIFFDLVFAAFISDWRSLF
jgi:hypothetical protein